jgi:hypothetical protein
MMEGKEVELSDDPDGITENNLKADMTVNVSMNDKSVTQLKAKNLVATRTSEAALVYWKARKSITLGKWSQLAVESLKGDVAKKMQGVLGTEVRGENLGEGKKALSHGEWNDMKIYDVDNTKQVKSHLVVRLTNLSKSMGEHPELFTGTLK